ncbi:MAG: sugar phosphate isomerase/epimerase [Clostridia bacterium]|nr:sugar phosphate isomerase/epimerase [Clostridia bacterium]
MKIGLQIEQQMVWFGERGALRQAAEAGFDTIDLSLHPKTAEAKSFMRDASIDEVYDHYAHLKEYADGLGLSFSQIHTPLRPAYYAHETEYNKAYFRTQEKSIAACAALGTPYAIFHMLQPPLERYSEVYQREGEALNIEFFGQLMPLLEKYRIQVCIENLFGITILPDNKLDYSLNSRIDDVLHIIDSYNKIFGEDRFVACVDTGHAFLMGQDPAEMIRTLGKRVRCLHVSDNDGAHDSHTAPYLGKIDWDDVLSALKEVDYSGSFNFEADGFALAFGPEGSADALSFLYKLGHRMTNRTGL